MPTLTSVMAELKRNGSARTRQTYRNAGVTGDLFGVSYAFLKKFHKKVKTDHDLALALWETGYLDARVHLEGAEDADHRVEIRRGGWLRVRVENGARMARPDVLVAVARVGEKPDGHATDLAGRVEMRLPAGEVEVWVGDSLRIDFRLKPGKANAVSMTSMR